MGCVANCCRMILLSIPSLLTLALIGFSLGTNWWLVIKDDELAKVKQTYKTNYEQWLQTDKEQTNIEYLYIEKQWPIIKYDSVYSKCIQYHNLHFKISNEFLTKTKKSPIRGAIIHYPKYILNRQNKGPICDDGFVRCFSSEQCVRGIICDGTADCNDLTDEQFCTHSKCQADWELCDSKCWKKYQLCNSNEPICFNRDDQVKLCAAEKKSQTQQVPKDVSLNQLSLDNITQSSSFKLGTDGYDEKSDCYREYFDFKSSKRLDLIELNYLNELMATNIQAELNFNYIIHLIFVITLCSAAIFCLLSLFTLLFVICCNKLCLQCPYWFYGFFAILTFISLSISLASYLYEFFIDTYNLQDVSKQLPLIREIYEYNSDIKNLQQLGYSFWTAVAACALSLLQSFISCIVCCRLPSSRHNDKEYEIMDIRSYNK